MIAAAISVYDQWEERNFHIFDDDFGGAVKSQKEALAMQIFEIYEIRLKAVWPQE
jgi:hypothetical protein